MDFFNQFRLANQGAPRETPVDVERFICDSSKEAVLPHTPLDSAFRLFSQGNSAFAALHSIPLPKRIHKLMKGDSYQKIYQEVVEATLHRIIQEQLEKIKKEHPEFAARISPKNTIFEENFLCRIKDNLSASFLDTLFTKEEIKTAIVHLLDSKSTLSEVDHSVLKICFYAWKHNQFFLDKNYGIRTHIFQSIIARGLTDLSDIIGESFTEDPNAQLYYGIQCCQGINGFDRGDMAIKADRWVAKWLDRDLLKTLIKAKNMTPLESSKTGKPSRNNTRKLHRYQNRFKSILACFMLQTPTVSQNVFRLVLPYISQAEPSLQRQIWDTLFQKYKVDPYIKSDIIDSLSNFLSQPPDREAQKTLYSVFVKTLPPEMRADILGHLPFKVLKKYWHTFRQINQNLPYIPVHTDKEQTYLAWHLFHERELNDSEIKSLLDKTDPHLHRQFLFSPKKTLDRDIFRHMCGVFAQSPFYFWQWVRSFQGIRDFPKSLAEIYPTLPESVRTDKKYVIAMNNHFDLIRKCAENGDISTLSTLKKILGPTVFWESLTRETADKISGIRSLCQQGKRGLLKLMTNLPLTQQQKLFMTCDANGRSLLDDCTGNLSRLVAQNIFNQSYIKETLPEVQDVSPVSLTPIQPVQPKPALPKVQRQIIRIPVFNEHMARNSNNLKLVQEVEETIQALSRMSKAEMATELREGWKHQGLLDRGPCAVKDIRGNKYRLGYLLKGDVDQGTGQIAFLFFLSHAQYNIFLKKQADQAVKVASSLMAAARSSLPSGPTGPAGGNEGR